MRKTSYIDRRILQIMPADGWQAAFADPDAPGGIFVEPLVCWALVRRIERKNLTGEPIGSSDTEVEGLTAGMPLVQFANDIVDNFIGYVAADYALDNDVYTYLREQAAEYLADHPAKSATGD